MSDSIIYVGMDVHKDSITMAILPDGADGDAARLERIPNELSRLRRLPARLALLGTPSADKRLAFSAGASPAD